MRRHDAEADDMARFRAVPAPDDAEPRDQATDDELDVEGHMPKSRGVTQPDDTTAARNDEGDDQVDERPHPEGRGRS
jgi:hypothetical protein